MNTEKSLKEIFEKVNMSISEIEKIAIKAAPIDSQNYPAFPNFTDTDIWINGFTDGYISRGNKIKEIHDELLSYITLSLQEAYNTGYKDGYDCSKLDNGRY